jgi:hypothetical protein
MHFFTTSASYWIGLNNIQKQSTWVWIDSNGQNNYTHWASGKPDNAQNDANCALLDEHHGFSWNNVHCSDLIHYICKKSEEYVFCDYLRILIN